MQTKDTKSDPLLRAILGALNSCLLITYLLYQLLMCLSENNRKLKHSGKCEVLVLFFSRSPEADRQSVQSWHSCGPQKPGLFLSFCFSIQSSLDLSSLSSPHDYKMAATPPAFTSKFQAGRTRRKRKQEGVQGEGGRPTQIVPFLVGKQRPSWKPYPKDFLLLTGQNCFLWPLLLDSDQGKRDFGWRLGQQLKV